LRTTLPVESWDTIHSHMRSTWKQGEHVCLVGPTGCGKTTLARELLPMRAFSVAFAVKRTDDTLSALGWPIIRQWPPERPSQRQVILWPKMDSMDAFQRQHDVMRAALRDIYRKGGWTVYADDLAYMSEMLKLDKEIRAIAKQGRSAKITLVSCIQRPSRVPIETYSEVGHLFAWRLGDGRDAKTLREIAGAGPVDPGLLMASLRQLPQHSFLYLDVHTGEMCQSELATEAVA
jgi:DNA polymerase III delta prime subunit